MTLDQAAEAFNSERAAVLYESHVVATTQPFCYRVAVG